MLRKILVFVFLFALVAASAQADIIMVPEDYDVIQAAVNAANPGDTIMVGPGIWPGAVINKNIEMIGGEGVYISGIGDPYDTGFAIGDGADGATVRNFSFEGVDSPVYIEYVDNVTVSHLNINNFMTGIEIFCSNGCTITNNEISATEKKPGQMNGILMMSYPGLSANDNLIAFNRISYNGPSLDGFGNWGIHFAAWWDEAFPPELGAPMTGNRIIHNLVQFEAEVTGVPFPYDLLNGGIGLGDLRGLYFNIYDFTGNYIGFNDARGSKNSEIGLLGVDRSENSISRNLGSILLVNMETVEVIETGESRAIDPEIAPEDLAPYRPVIR